MSYLTGHRNTLIEGYFRRSQRSVGRTVLFGLVMLIGVGAIIWGITQQEYLVVAITSALMILISIGFLRGRKRTRIRVRFKDGTLTVQGGGYHIQLKEPFRYQAGVERIRPTRNMPEFHYVRLVVDVYGKPLVFEEHVPTGVQPPDLDEIIGASSALGIAELSSLETFPGTLWAIIQKLDATRDKSQQSRLQMDIEQLYRIGGNQLNSEDYYGAIRTFSEIVRLTPESPFAYYNRGIAHFYRKEDLSRAITDLTTAIRLKPDFDKAYRMRGLTRSEQGDWAGLRDDISTAIQLNPRDGDLYNIRGGACFRLQDYQSALADFDKATQLSGHNPEPYHNRGLVKQRIGDINGAIADFRQALFLNPHFERSRESLQEAEAQKRELGL